MKHNILKKAAVFSLAMPMLAGCGETAQETAKEPESEMVSTAAATEEAQVQVDAGTLIGLKTGDLYSFRGIPYATAERFKSPEPVTEYENGYQLAFSWGPVSPQARTLSASASPNPYELLTPGNGTADLVGNENCQNLNVWTSDLSSQKPVIVFFHGGGLTSGSSGELSYYTGEYIAQSEDVVFVSVNHRLNVLGFLDLSAYGEEYRNSGIAGLEDCVEALRWVNRNIHAFGGDPDNVTIIGQSGGGDKVTTLACMPETENLFDKAVVMSGYYSDIPQAAGMAETAEMIEKLGLSEDEAAQALTEMPYEELLAASAGMTFDYARVGTGSFTKPFLDENGRCSIYAFRPGFCRLFPLGRYYVDEAVGNTQEEISHDAGAEKSSCNTEAEKKTCAAEAEKMSGDAETEKMSGDAAEGKLSGEPSENAQFCGKITHGRKRGFYYFLQKGECTKADAERYEVKVSDWIGVEDMDPYEKFICTWHFFLKDTAAQLARFPEKAREQIARSVLQIFYVQPYDRFQDFYPQFEARLASTEKQLAKIGFRYDADW